VNARRFRALALWLASPLNLCLNVSPAFAQSVRSPEVHPDKRVTFRLRAPNAKAVFVAREGAQRLAMQKDAQGVWTITTDPVEPDFYGYSFQVDGVGTIDPSNPLMKPNLLNTQSMVHVPGPASLPWEVNDVPHGVVHHRYYKSSVVGDERDYFVYLPPGYEANKSARYPVLYLLHGFSDDASGWTAVGRANVILDNLIAQGKAQPMLVVMPLGYGAPEIVSPSGSPLRDPALSQRNFDRFRDSLLKEVIPQVDGTYRTRKDRLSRAITGLSMGGGESLFVGLNGTDKFAWIGSFSGALVMIGQDYGKQLPAVNTSINSKVRLLWIACGKDDFLLDANHKLEDWLKSKEVRHTKIETSGAHTWMVWRRNLAEFAPLLFR
jgi:enterochelin esterase-like enzyme